MMKILKDFPKSKRKVIITPYDEVEVMNDGEMKNEPEHYLKVWCYKTKEYKHLI